MLETEKLELLRQHFPAWPHLSETEQQDMLKNCRQISYAKGAFVHNAENECVGVLLIIKGRLRTYMLSEEGKEITLYRLQRGNICILSASCVLSTITFDVEIEAEEDSDVLLISAPFFAQLAEHNIYVECFSYKLATDRFSDVMWAMQQILFMSMDKRLAVFLWDELSKTEGDLLHLTHEQTAKYMGSAREVVTRMLKYFSSEGIVELSRGTIRILDREKLRRLTQ
ncbi:MAG: Crp/Fnr family transcriptional regulator [Negativicutes bacterium]|nr:Crp/Fnr family transcriptional regulator [Negativicutes bacterium]